MASGVFVLKDDDTLVSMAAAHFASEDDFQDLLAKFPPQSSPAARAAYAVLFVSARQIPRHLRPRPSQASEPLTVEQGNPILGVALGDADDPYRAVHRR